MKSLLNILHYARFSLFIIYASLTIPLIAYGEEHSFDINTNARIVAFGDVHGAFDDLVSLLEETGIIDSDLNWAGKDSHLVSLGDLIDRGPRSRDVVELIMKLQAQAPESGGEVHVVLGNHEIMVMTGDRDYVTQTDYIAFARDEAENEREELRQRFIKDHNHSASENIYEEFEKQYPSGFIGLDRAFGPEGHIGGWLLKQNVVLKINDTVFIHGGIPSQITGKSLAEINREGMSALGKYMGVVERLRKAGVLPVYVGFYNRTPHLNSRAKELIDADPDINRDMNKRPAWFDDFLELNELQNERIFNSYGPLWYRGTSRCNIHCESFNTERFLKNVNANRVVIGHTPTPDRKVTARMDGMVIQLDTGMLKSYYKGRASVLIIEGENLYVRYSGNPVKESPENESYRLSQKLSGMSDAELEDFLLTGEIIDRKNIGAGITRPLKIKLKKGDKTINAVFKTEDSHPRMQSRNNLYSRSAFQESDRYIYDVAAYRLDRMIDLQMVPVAVSRKIDGKEGVVQYWVENSINERDREQSNINFESYCRKNEQYWLRFIFDVLIYNEDRNLTNILWTKEDFMMVFIDHSRAFRTTKRRPRQYRDVPLNLSDLFRRKLEDLNRENLTESLSPYLHPLQITAILERRDLILREGKTTD